MDQNFNSLIDKVEIFCKEFDREDCRSKHEVFMAFLLKNVVGTKFYAGIFGHLEGEAWEDVKDNEELKVLVEDIFEKNYELFTEDELRQRDKETLEKIQIKTIERLGEREVENVYNFKGDFTYKDLETMCSLIKKVENGEVDDGTWVREEHNEKEE